MVTTRSQTKQLYNPAINPIIKPTVKTTVTSVGATTRLQYNEQTINIFNTYKQTFDPVINFNIGENFAKLNLQHNKYNYNVIYQFIKKMIFFYNGNNQQRINSLYLIYVLLLNNIWWFEISNFTKIFKQTFIERLPTDLLSARNNTKDDMRDFINIIIQMSKKLNTIL